MGLEDYSKAFEHLATRECATAFLSRSFEKIDAEVLLMRIGLGLDRLPESSADRERAKNHAALQAARKRVVKSARRLETELARLEKLLVPLHERYGPHDIAAQGADESQDTYVERLQREFRAQRLRDLQAAKTLGIPADLTICDAANSEFRKRLGQLVEGFTRYEPTKTQRARKRTAPGPFDLVAIVALVACRAESRSGFSPPKPMEMAALECLARGTFKATQKPAAQCVKAWEGWLSRNRQKIADRIEGLLRVLDGHDSASPHSPENEAN